MSASKQHIAPDAKGNIHIILYFQSAVLFFPLEIVSLQPKY